MVKINSPKGLKNIMVTAYSMDGKIVSLRNIQD
jgi:hypothetical protein